MQANQLTTERAAFTGQNAEDSFERIARKFNWTIRRSSRYEDRVLHFDFVMSRKDKGSFKVEVKGRKSFAVNSAPSFLLVEFSGITGENGWIYGEADLIAYEQNDGNFIVVPRIIVMQTAERLCDGHASKREEMLYRYYRRKDREDCVSAIKVSDVEGKYSVWKI